MLGVLAILVCALIYYRKSPGKSDPTPTTLKGRGESEAAPPPVAPVQHQAETITPLDGGSGGSEGSVVDAGLQANTRGSVMQQIRDSIVTNPGLAESLVLQVRAQNPEAPDQADPEADELDALLVAAIFNQHQIDRARVEARRYFRRHPGGRYTEYLMRETRMHPPPAAARN